MAIKVLLECSNALVRLDRREALARAGYEVLVCEGPRHRSSPEGPCPLLDDRRCDLVEDADVVVNHLSPKDLAVGMATRLRYPDTPTVIVLAADDAERLGRLLEGAVITGAGSDAELIAAVERARRGQSG